AQGKGAWLRVLLQGAGQRGATTRVAPALARVGLLLRVCRLAVRGRGAEFVRARKTLGRKAPGVGTIATPVGELLRRERKGAPGAIGPGQARLRLERLQVGEPTVAVTLQPPAAAARHFGHLVEREDHHLPVLPARGTDPPFHPP